MEVRHPQTVYAGLQKSLQQEWAFVEHVTLGIGPEFHPVEDELCDAFLPALFKGAISKIPRRAVTGIPLTAPTGKHPVSSQDASLQISMVRLSFGWRIMPS